MTGLDTETHKGKCVLMATPRAFLEPWRLIGEDRFEAILRFLWRADRHHTFVCWNADYDIQAILKWLPRSVSERLHRFSRAKYKTYRLRFVSGKFFTVHEKTQRLLAVYDLQQFYALTLKKACEKYLEGQKSSPGVDWSELLWSLRRGSRSLATVDEIIQRNQIIDYCMTDAKRCEELYELSRENMARIGVDFKRPVSCASVASQKFGKMFDHEVPKHINLAFQRTFNGGRMECLRLGFFPRAYLYDLHSAYPSVIRTLPEIPKAWQKITKAGVREDALFAAVRTRFRIPDGEHTGPVAADGDGQLMYPIGTWDRWLDLETFRLLESRGWIEHVFGGWQAAITTDRFPFASIGEMYEERLKTPANAWALKIIMNAWYGKLAQRMERWVKTGLVTAGVEAWNGSFWRRREQWTRKTCFPYASAITAAIRKRLYTEVDRRKTIFYATDGVALTEPDLNLKSGPGLGEWSEVEEIRDLLVVGSGVYCYRTADDRVRTKFRGFDVGLDLYSLLDTRKSLLRMEVKRNVTMAAALIQSRWQEFNEIQDVPRFLDVNFDRKRIWPEKRTGRDVLTKQYESKPWRYYGRITI